MGTHATRKKGRVEVGDQGVGSETQNKENLPKEQNQM